MRLLRQVLLYEKLLTYCQLPKKLVKWLSQTRIIVYRLPRTARLSPLWLMNAGPASRYNYAARRWTTFRLQIGRRTILSVRVKVERTICKEQLNGRTRLPAYTQIKLRLNTVGRTIITIGPGR